MSVSSSSLLHDPQGRWYEQLSPTQILTGLESNHHQQQRRQQQQRKKCHGNKKLRRYRNKHCQHGMNEGEITTLISEHNHTNENQTTSMNQVSEIDFIIEDLLYELKYL